MGRGRGGSRWAVARGAILLALATASVGMNTAFEAPPRFDGAGYAVLARSLLSGRGYREIDQPDEPRHAHFPPGYPLALAALWRLTGPSATAAHVFSCGCTVAAVLLTWAWFRRLYPPRTAFTLGIALAVNWTWGRAGGSIQSEPPYLLLEAIIRLAAVRVATRDDRRLGPMLGALLGASVLTRHVAACMALAVLIDLLWRHRTRTAIVAGLVAGALLLPWAGWLATVRHHTQVGLLRRDGLADVLSGNALFYLRRIPDQIIGPLVEVGTVFRPALRWPATAWAALATALISAGWARCLSGSRRRLAALVPMATFPLLLAWPFTEAGRFLIPLVPYLLVGAVEGLAMLLGRSGRRRARRWSAVAIASASIPYAAYAVASDRAGASRRAHADFDAACAWIASRGDLPGPILSRQPGEVFLRTGRRALAPSDEGTEAIDRLIERHHVAYLLVDERRYVRSAASPLGRYVTRRPGRVHRVWEREAIAVYAVDPAARASAR